VRKRIVIGLIVVTGVVVALAMFSRPRRGTVEYHKRGYELAEREMMGDTWKHRLAMRWHKLRGATYSPYIDMSDPNNPQTRSEMHEQALIDLGYWVKREWDLTNKTAHEMVNVLLKPIGGELPNDDTRMWTMHPQTNRIGIRSRPAEMSKWEERIRKIDVPESGK
jgi:hypothetical protein